MKTNKNATNTSRRNKKLRPLNLKCPVLYLNKENNPAKAGTEMKTVQQLERLQVYSSLGSSSAQSERESPLQVWVSGTGEREAPSAETRGVPPFAHLSLLHKASEELVFCWRILTSLPWAGSTVTLAGGFRATVPPRVHQVPFGRSPRPCSIEGWCSVTMATQHWSFIFSEKPRADFCNSISSILCHSGLRFIYLFTYSE